MPTKRTPWLLLVLPIIPLLALLRRFRRRVRPGGGPGGGPPPAGVREPRRPSPTPPAAAVSRAEPGA
ncbi:hypothetical protein ABZ721_22100 [Streptomyces sp. NPDC006733]|uniref:hypothetical protein n=1 Tax=Streptomyces sp. NPDC006733 TaxID=3155460 RepID=UPI0033C2125D